MVIPSGPLAAMACIRGTGSIRGTVKFYPVNCGTLVVAQIFGLPGSIDGFYGMHIHEGGSCTGEGFADTRGHYDPQGNPHPRHAGDLPPLLSQNGKALLAVETDRINVWEIIGRTVVIHSRSDDFRSQPAGDAGSKIACSVICKI